MSNQSSSNKKSDETATTATFSDLLSQLSLRHTTAAAATTPAAHNHSFPAAAGVASSLDLSQRKEALVQNNSHPGENTSINSTSEEFFLLSKYRQMSARKSHATKRKSMDDKDDSESSEEARKPPATAETLADESTSQESNNNNSNSSGRVYRSVQDYTSTEALREALSLCSVDPAPAKASVPKSATAARSTPPLEKIDSTATVVMASSGQRVSVQRGHGVADWLLSMPDDDAEPQSVETELSRLWTLKSYLALDAEKEAAFDALCEKARLEFNVPMSSISLVDLGRQFAFGDAGLPAETPRDCPRRIAFCAHSILSRHNICVVNDTLQDDRFRQNQLVVQDPHLRFYAGAPLISPEGYKLGTFCVEGPEPRPQGLTPLQIEKLRRYAQQAMELLVQRKQRLLSLQHDRGRGRASVDSPAFVSQAAAMMDATEEVGESSSAATTQPHRPQHLEVDQLRTHAGITTNLGGLLYYLGDCVTAMHLFQESVQSLMCLEAASNNTIDAAKLRLPTRERHEEMAQLLAMLQSETNTKESKKAFAAIARKLFAGADEEEEQRECDLCTVDGFPGLFGRHSTKLRGAERLHSGLVFAEPFRIAVQYDATIQKGRETDQNKHFIIPLEQCSKATLFNMGLVHYHWGRVDTAMQFFDLASSMSQQLPPLAFDPVILASFNNMAQIHLQFGRTNDAMELLQDALTRGNAALAALYSDAQAEWKAQHSTLSGQSDARRSRRLRRKLARTVMNMGHVHYINCEYNAAMVTCHDALRLLHPNTEDAEVASVWHNMGILLYHQGQKEDAIAYLANFIERGKQLVGHDHLQLAEAYALQGLAIFEMGQLYDCMSPLNEALRIRRLKTEKNSTRGNHQDDVLTAESLCYLGRVFQAREEYDFCLSAFLQGMEIHRRVAGPAGLSFETAQTLLDVGRAYMAQNCIPEALETYNEVTGLTRRFFGARSAFVARLLNIEGNLHLELGQALPAMKKFAEAMEIHAEQGLPLDYAVVKDPLCRVQLRHAPHAGMA